MALIQTFRDLQVYQLARINTQSYPAAFANKVSEALGEAIETQAWLDHAIDCKYIDEKEFEELDSSWQQIGGMLRKMMQKTPEFCRNSNRYK